MYTHIFLIIPTPPAPFVTWHVLQLVTSGKQKALEFFNVKNN